MSSAMQEGALVTYALDEIVDTLSSISTFTDNAQRYTPTPCCSRKQASNTQNYSRKIP